MWEENRMEGRRGRETSEEAAEAAQLRAPWGGEGGPGLGISKGR